MIDQELRASIQEQSFLGKFNLIDVDEGLEKPIPFVCEVYVNKYPGFYLECIHNHFIRYMNKAKSNQLWLQWEETPLKWGIPFLGQINIVNEEVEISVRTRKRPDSLIPMVENLRTELKNRYFWTLKQACMIRFKNRWDKQIFQVLSIEQQNQMFQDYSDVKLHMDFYEKFDRIWDNNILKKENQIGIPIRFIVGDMMLQRGFVMEKGDESLKDVIQATFEDVLNHLFKFKSLKYEKIFVQGLEVGDDLPVRCLFFQLYNPDGFTYIVIR